MKGSASLLTDLLFLNLCQAEVEGVSEGGAEVRAVGGFLEVYVSLIEEVGILSQR